MRKTVIRSISAMLVVLTIFMSSAMSASAASWKTGAFDSGYTAKGYTTVYLQKGTNGKNKDAKIKIYTYNAPLPQLSTKSYAKIHVVLRTTSGAWICEFDKYTGYYGATLNLGGNYSAYRVYISKANMGNSGDNFVNSGSCTYWSINTTQNCYL